MTPPPALRVIKVEVERDRHEQPGLDHRVVVYIDVPGYGSRSFHGHLGSREHCDDVRDRMLGTHEPEPSP
ncbi:MAG: hypothetical protein EKK55_14720 [Rhodocyclaceae bacterium]|nr:MAG: hypothetical protein EKK55_14720 [Rhodocyclaceae bacterium]